MTPLLSRTGTRECLLGDVGSLPQIAGQQVDPSKGEITACLKSSDLRLDGRLLRQCLDQELPRTVEATIESVGLAQGCRYSREKGGQSRLSTDAHGVFEMAKGSEKVALAQTKPAKPPPGEHSTGWVRGRFGNLKRFFRAPPPVGEYPHLTMGPGEEGTGNDSRHEGHPAVAARGVFGRSRDLLEACDRRLKVPLEVVQDT